MKIMFFVLLLLGASTLVAQTGAPDGADAIGQSEEASTLMMGPGDLLDISVYDVPELTLKVRLDDHGNVSLPLIGKQHFAGLTAMKAEQLVKADLVEGGFVHNPEVTILVEEYATQGITVSGEVNQPGIYPLLGPHRLYDAISAAGGLTSRAGRTVVIVHKNKPQESETLDFPRNSNVIGANVVVSPGDTIVVSKAGVVYVVGEVTRPGAFLMENNTNLTILQAIAMSQGPTKTAALDNAKIVRKTPQGITEIPVQLGKILKARVPDRVLEADDIVFVPGSKLRGAGQLSARSVVAVAASLALYTVR